MTAATTHPTGLPPNLTRHGPECSVPACDRPVPDNAYLCEKCATRLRRDLSEVPSLVRELEVTVARLGRTGSSGGRRGASVPLPFDWDASVLVSALGNTLTTWARDVAYTRGMQSPAAPAVPLAGPACQSRCGHGSCATVRVDRRLRLLRPASVAARWLVGQVGWIRHYREGVQLADEVHYAVAAARRQVEARPDLWYAGPCGSVTLGQRVVAAVFGGDPEVCDAQLYARPDADVVRCRVCDTVFGVAERRGWLLASAEDSLAHAALIASALTSLDRPVTVDRIYQWAHRGRLVARSEEDAEPGEEGRRLPLYRVGDVLDLLDEAERRAAERAGRRVAS